LALLVRPCCNPRPMKFSTKALLAACAAPLAFGSDDATSPVLKVLKLLNELKSRIEGDGKAEQQSYDKNACWCEDTLARKAKDMSNAKVKIEELSTLILKLEGETATHQAEMAQLEKDVASNQQSQNEATGARDKANAEYIAVKTESEQALGALAAATEALSGAGEGKKGSFRQKSMQEAQLLSVSAGVREVLAMSASAHTMSDEDFQVVNHFVTSPTDFLNGHSSTVLSAAQMAQNPFGDYAPKSGQIQGILKSMHDAFTDSLAKAIADEEEAVKSHTELMATKKQEFKTLTASLEKHTGDNAEKVKTLAESKQLRDDTKEQLDADEVFFQRDQSRLPISCKGLG